MITFISFLIAVIVVQTVDCTCSFSNGTGGPGGSGSITFHISENDTSGTVVITGIKNISDTVSIDLKTGHPTALGVELQASFMLTATDTTFQVTNTKKIDLESLWKDHGRDMSRISITIRCTNNTLSPVIAVDPVDEFPPKFNASVYTTTVPENTNIGMTVFRLSPLVHDADIPPGANDLVYAIQQFTGALYFACDPGTGDITLQKKLDYDAPGALRSFRVNIRVSEFGGLHLAGDATLEVTVKNIEDVPPYFKYPHCPPPCMAPLFDSLTSLTQTGALTLRPTSLKGGDDEGFNTPLVFSISQGNGHNMFVIDPNTGEVHQTISVSRAQASESEFRLIIEVKKNMTDLSAIAVLVIRVKERLGNATTSCLSSSPPISAPPESGTSWLIPFLVAAVFAVLFLAGLVFTVVKYRRKHNESHVRPIQVKPGMQNGGLQTHGLTIGGTEYNNKSFTNALPVFNKNQPLSTLK